MIISNKCWKFGKLSSGHRTGKGQFSFQSPKKGNAKECSNYCTISLISHTSKVTLKILQARLQQYVNHELLDVQAGFRKGRRTRDQIANIRWIIKKAREFQKNIRPPNLPLRNLIVGQEATVRTGHGTADWFQIGKGVRQGCILSPCFFNFYAEYIMRNAGLEEVQARIKIAWRIPWT